MDLDKKDVAEQGRWSNFLKSPVDWLMLVGLLGLVPLVWTEARSLWAMKHYQFFPLAWLAFALVVYLRGHVSTTAHRGRSVLGWVAMLCAILLTVLAVLLIYPKVAQIAAIGVLLAWMLLRLGGNPWFEVFAWITLLVVTVRLPVIFDQGLVHTLQAISSQSASHLLDLTGIPHLPMGNIIEIRQKELFVEEACSGVDSFYALSAVALMLAVWQRRGFVVSMLTILSVPLWAWFGNVIRLYLLAFLLSTFEIDLTEGTAHTVLGLVIFSLSFGGLLSMQEAFTRLLAPLPGGESASEWAPRFYNWLVAWPGRRFDEEGLEIDDSPTPVTTAAAKGIAEQRPGALSWVVPGIGILVFLVCGVVTAGPVLGIGSKKIKGPRLFDKGAVDLTFAEDQLPEDFGGMKRKSFKIEHREQNSMFGAHSATWVFQDQSRDVVISLDFIFTVFHPLEVCYISKGDKILGDIKQYESTSSGPPQFISEVNLKDLFGEQAYLIYTEFNDDGVSAERMEVFSLSTFFNKGIFQKSIGPLFQLQLLASDGDQLSEEDQKRYRQILEQARELLLPKVQQLTGTGPVASAAEGGAADAGAADAGELPATPAPATN
jgi:exosortase